MALIATGSVYVGAADRTRDADGDNGQVFYKPGMTLSMYDADKYQCELETRRLAHTFGTNDPAERFAHMCMKAKGYSLVRKSRIREPIGTSTPRRRSSGLAW